ncbi:hypothetical protein JVU11DRAFT_10173 [Chiua virens]|nr:hypothetical protein JVU11DRAFT_10173 [Chiua virens]
MVSDMTVCFTYTPASYKYYFVSFLTLMAAGPLFLAVPAMAGTVVFEEPNSESRLSPGQHHVHVAWTVDGAEGTTSDLVLIYQGEQSHQYKLRGNVHLEWNKVGVSIPGNVIPGPYVVAFTANPDYVSGIFEVA